MLALETLRMKWNAILARVHCTVWIISPFSLEEIVLALPNGLSMWIQLAMLDRSKGGMAVT